MNFTRHKQLLSMLLVSIALLTQTHAYPLIDQAVATGGEPIRVYRDHADTKVFWYIPQSIEPWQRDGTYRSSFYRDENALSFVFRGQASVEERMLKRVAAALNISVSQLTPIAYDYSRNFICQNFYMQEDAVAWLFPTMIGNYLEVVPVSLRTRNKLIFDELEYHLTRGGGLGCTVEVGFKALYSKYNLKLEADFNKVYKRFEAGAHAEGLWWEVDLHTMIESLRRDHVIKITSLEDTAEDPSEFDKKIQAAMDEVMKHIVTSMFTPALKLPQGELAGRGKAWSLRTDYVESRENSNYQATLDSRRVTVKNSQISLRMALE